MTTEKILFGRFKNSLLIDRAPKYLKWLKSESQGKDPHHLLGSQGSLKLTDYLIVMVTREEHIEAEKHKCRFFFDNLHTALNNLFRYIKYLEKK